MSFSRRHFLLAAAAAAVIGLPATAMADEGITIAYQTSVEPSKVPQADGLYEKAIGQKLNWRKFEAGAEVIAAVASGDVQIGFLGSSPLAAAASRGLPIQTFFIAGQLGSAEALVTRNGSKIESPKDLPGKKVATPFVSTAHYSLLSALKHWQIDSRQVQVINLRPSEITAAWQRGDIDAAYVWDPALSKARESGKVLATSADVGRWGAPTFDTWIVRRDFAARHPEVLVKFVKVTLDAYADYRKDPARWDAASPQVQKIARLTGASPADVPGLLAGTVFPLAREQLSAGLLGGGTARALLDTSRFLKAQNKVDQVQASYQPFVETRYVRQAAGL